MKKIVLLLSVFAIFTTCGFAQDEAALSLPIVNVENLSVGDEIVVPLRLVSTTPEDMLIVDASLIIEYDQTFIDFEGRQNFHAYCPDGPSWVFYSTEDVYSSIWNDPTWLGVDFEDNAIFFEYVFTYLGGLEPGEESALTWGENSGFYLSSSITTTLINGKLCNGCVPTSTSAAIDETNEVELYTYKKTIYVNIDNPEPRSIVVYDLLGQEVLRTAAIQGKNTIQMEQGNYYVVSVLLDDSVVNTKVFVQ